MARKIHLDLQKLHYAVTGRRKGTELAHYWGVARNTVQRRLTGETPMTWNQINDICEVIGVDIDEFIEIKKAA